jgi:hypothetical protein
MGKKCMLREREMKMWVLGPKIRLISVTSFSPLCFLLFSYKCNNNFSLITFYRFFYLRCKKYPTNLSKIVENRLIFSRYVAYRMIFYQIHGKMGKGVRRKLPNCLGANRNFFCWTNRNKLPYTNAIFVGYDSLGVLLLNIIDRVFFH